MTSPAPIIGVFDSGVGGLTVVRALRRQLPHAHLLYLGDTARVPYGTKSAQVVERYATNCARFLHARGATQLVIACNTASAYALHALRKEFALPVVGVVEPGAALAAERSISGRIGVVATEGTIASGSYQRAIHTLRPDAEVVAQACPLFVPLAEEGFIDHPATELVAREYLEPLRDAAVDTVVLGCTHYPLLEPLIQRVLGDEITLVDSASAIAQSLDAQSSASPSADGEWHFFATDVSERVHRVGSAFLDAPLPKVEWVDIGS